MIDTSNTPDVSALAKPVKTGSEVIFDFVKMLPGVPGVYRMIDTNGDVLYVGKAHNLRKRVTSYTRPQGLNNRIARMIQATVTMEFVTTATETEALLLEANLIKRLRPRFNVLLRDDKSFPYILLTGDHEAPQIVKHRGARKRKGQYFGPFASAGAVTRTINALQKAFLIRNCSDGVYQGRSRPCLLYQIKRCSAPCTGEITVDKYSVLVDEAVAFLSGKSQKIREELAQSMNQASAQLDFEAAAIYRDRISALSAVQTHQGINPQSVDEADVFACHEEAGQTCIQVFFFRTGQNWGNRAYYPKADISHTTSEILGSFLSQFYDDKPCPKQILLSEVVPEQALLSEAFTLKSARKIEVLSPQRGEKRDLVTHALKNAEDALGRRLAENASQARLLEGVAGTFDLAETPRRIEVYDNSHIMGTNAVGCMIVSGPEGLAKNQYRKFNIKSKDLVPGDDYGMMREVFSRRFSRLLKEHGTISRDDTETQKDALPPWPDLILIDGGKGQLSVVREVMLDLGLGDIPLVGIAKGPERDAGREKFFVPGKPSFMLAERDPVLYFVQRLRDEAHRFAIGTHRARRSKQMIRNPLDDIAGIGPTRKRALLQHLGSAKAVSRAALSDLEAVPGISQTMARNLYDYFHDNDD